MNTSILISYQSFNIHSLIMKHLQWNHL